MSQQISNPAPAVPAVFQFEGHVVRMIEEECEAWFNVNDICTALTFKNPRDAVQRHVDSEDVVKRDTPDNQGTIQSCNYVNESGMHSLVLGSTKSEAKRFKRWVTKEVLPSIRKHGHYMTSAQTIPTLPTQPMELLFLAVDSIKQLNCRTLQIESRTLEVETRTAQAEDMALEASTKVDELHATFRLHQWQQYELKEAVNHKVKALQKQITEPVGKIFAQVYGFLKRHFKVTTYGSIPAIRFDEAKMIITNMTAEQIGGAR